MSLFSALMTSAFGSLMEQAPTIDWTARRQAALVAVEQAVEKDHCSVGRYTKVVLARVMVVEINRFCDARNHDSMKYIEDHIASFAVTGRICL